MLTLNVPDRELAKRFSANMLTKVDLWRELTRLEACPLAPSTIRTYLSGKHLQNNLVNCLYVASIMDLSLLDMYRPTPTFNLEEHISLDRIESLASMDYREVCNRFSRGLRKAIKRKHISAYALSTKTFLSSAAILHYKAGKYLPTSKNALLISSVLQTEISELFI